MPGEKILLVDDDKEQLKGLNIRLKAQGYQVVFAGDAITAISMARREQPDLIILDLGLPAGDGFLVMKRLQDLVSVSHIPIIILSARDRVHNEERALHAGAFAYFQKPVENHELLAAIEEALALSH